MGSMEEVHMPQNGINHAGVTALAEAMQHNPGLRILNLNDNTFTEKGAMAMAQVYICKGLVVAYLDSELFFFLNRVCALMKYLKSIWKRSFPRPGKRILDSLEKGMEICFTDTCTKEWLV